MNWPEMSVVEHLAWAQGEGKASLPEEARRS